MDVIIGILGDPCELLLFGSRIVVCGKALAGFFRNSAVQFGAQIWNIRNAKAHVTGFSVDREDGDVYKRQ